MYTIYEMKKVGEAIRAIDNCSSVSRIGQTPENIERLWQARKNLINFLFDNGFELAEWTSRVIKSKHPRPLV